MSTSLNQATINVKKSSGGDWSKNSSKKKQGENFRRIKRKTLAV